MAKKVFLLMISEENNNKYYNMIDNETGSFVVEYGRIEKTKITETYPMSMWDKKYREKLKKGYQDVTYLRTETVISSDGTTQLSDIKNSEVKKLIDTLQAYAKKSIKANYTVSSEAVTQAMVDAAQQIIDDLNKSLTIGSTKDDINSKLLKLYSVIPRLMKNVKFHLLDGGVTNQAIFDSTKEMLKKEQDTLDVMAGQVSLNRKNKELENPEKVQETMTLLDLMGLEIIETTDAEVKQIKDLLGNNRNQYRRSFKLINKKTQSRYDSWLRDAKNKKEELLWHGSRNENWFNIIETGLLIRPSGAVYTGSMWGDGCYFANKAQKSINYTSYQGSYYAKGSDSRAYLALFKVHVGNQAHFHNHTSKSYSLNEKELRKDGFDSTYAHAGASIQNDEFIVYNIAQCTVQYIVEIG